MIIIRIIWLDLGSVEIQSYFWVTYICQSIFFTYISSEIVSESGQTHFLIRKPIMIMNEVFTLCKQKHIMIMVHLLKS